MVGKIWCDSWHSKYLSRGKCPAASTQVTHVGPTALVWNGMLSIVTAEMLREHNVCMSCYS